MKEPIYISGVPKDIKIKLKDIANKKGMNLKTICIMAFEEFIKRNMK